jgi:hypothetical protein
VKYRTKFFETLAPLAPALAVVRQELATISSKLPKPRAVPPRDLDRVRACLDQLAACMLERDLDTAQECIKRCTKTGDWKKCKDIVGTQAPRLQPAFTSLEGQLQQWNQRNARLRAIHRFIVDLTRV